MVTKMIFLRSMAKEFFNNPCTIHGLRIRGFDLRDPPKRGPRCPFSGLDPRGGVPPRGWGDPQNRGGYPPPEGVRGRKSGQTDGFARGLMPKPPHEGCRKGGPNGQKTTSGRRFCQGFITKFAKTRFLVLQNPIQICEKVTGFGFSTPPGDPFRRSLGGPPRGGCRPPLPRGAGGLKVPGSISVENPVHFAPFSDGISRVVMNSITKKFFR